MGKDKETKINKREKEKENKKKKFREPELLVYDNLSDITMFTTASNASGSTFF